MDADQQLQYKSCLMFLDFQYIVEAICQQHLLLRQLIKSAKCRIQEVQYFKAYYYNLSVKFTNLRSLKDILFPQYCSMINLNFSNQITDEEQYVDLWFLLQTNVKSLIQENVITQICLEVCYRQLIIQLNLVKLVCKKLICFQIYISVFNQ
ncbi:Hypothetical_protein [Hexamita inflata]|uniref:Hypothetical_protein n=1 Tax=Hexamita inflata TaxID=28002 RepID=A0AA86UX05_9EUKA|nr:Hypothetical protein HINF_LOCUS55757 [Hexamita inflata]